MLPLHFLKSQAASAQTEKAMTLIIDAIKFTMHGDLVQGWRRWTVFVKRHRQERRYLSSIRVQTVWRMRQARKVLARKVQVRDKQLRKAERKRQLEAQKLQRLRMKSATSVQKNYRAMQARVRFKYMVQQRLLGATRMQSFVRTFLSKKILRALDLAARQKRGAIALQSLFRGYEGRRRADLLRRKKLREARDAQLTDKAFVVTRFFQEQGATLLLQRWWHSMRKVRVPFEFKGHDAVIPLQTLLRKYLVQKSTSQELARRRKVRLRLLLFSSHCCLYQIISGKNYFNLTIFLTHLPEVSVVQEICGRAARASCAHECHHCAECVPYISCEAGVPRASRRTLAVAVGAAAPQSVTTA